MDRDTLQGLEQLNQLALTEEQKAKVLGFFAAQEAAWKQLDALDTEHVERMVHVSVMENVLREDVAEKKFSRDDLQAGAPETMDGYWQVPRLVG